MPSLNFPLNIEQALTAYRLSEAGLGATCHPGHEKAFRLALESMLSETRYLKAALAFANRYQAFSAKDCVDTIVQHVEQLVI